MSFGALFRKIIKFSFVFSPYFFIISSNLESAITWSFGRIWCFAVVMSIFGLLLRYSSLMHSYSLSVKIFHILNSFSICAKLSSCVMSRAACVSFTASMAISKIGYVSAPATFLHISSFR